MALTDLHVYYGDAHVLHGIDLTVAAGESVCVMGPNGAGKSTLLKAIAGAVAPRTGTITLDGDRISGRGERCAVKWIPADPCQHAHRNQRRNQERANQALLRTEPRQCENKQHTEVEVPKKRQRPPGLGDVRQAFQNLASARHWCA